MCKFVSKMTDDHAYTQTYKVKLKMASEVEGDPKAPFSIATSPMCREKSYSFPSLHLTLDPEC